FIMYGRRAVLSTPMIDPHDIHWGADSKKPCFPGGFRCFWINFVFLKEIRSEFVNREGAYKLSGSIADSLNITFILNTSFHVWGFRNLQLLTLQFYHYQCEYKHFTIVS
ncbi:hypothetical protein ACJX0J_040875, partial [Zea mays]